MAGAPDIVDKLKKGYKAIGRTYKNHIDGFNFLPYLTGKEKEEPAQVLLLLQRRRRHARHPLRQLEAGVHGAALPRARCRCGPSRSRGCGCPSSSTCAPIRTSSRTSPRTRTTTGSCTTRYFIYAAQAVAAKFAATFKDFPPIQKPNTFTIDDAMAKMREAAAGAD